VLTEEALRWIREAWQLEPTEVYASTETLYLAASAPPYRELHVFDDLAVVEVVDEENRPEPPGEPGYKVLVTNLVNRAQPLIRYELANSVTLAEGPDPAGRPFTRIATVDGRSDDVIRLPARAGGEIAVLPYQLYPAFTDAHDVRQYQLVWDGTELVARVVSSVTPSDVKERIRRGVEAALAAAGATAPPIRVVSVDAIEREAGHAAKVKLVKVV
jgi:phenylacetate-CoA ligase